MATSHSLNPGVEIQDEFGAGMNAQNLVTHFNRISGTPDAVSRLRRFIFDLAVRGKLVPQDPNDEPASELIKAIAFTRNERFLAGEVRRAKKLPSIAASEVLYDIPKSWSWVRANALWDFENGDRGKSYPSRDELVNEGIPFVNAGHLVDGLVSMSQMNYITPERYKRLNGGKLRTGDQIFCLRGSLGKHAIYSHPVKGAIASSLVILRPIEPKCVAYLFIYLESQVAREMLQRFDNGSAQPNLSSGNLRKYGVPLPPLAEQHRIVAKVDELMSLCDLLEAARVERETTRNRLAAASLARLNAPHPDPVVFRKDAAFALGNFTALTPRPEQIKSLRQTILNLAVRGKLVPQDPTDEPARILLTRISAEKARVAGTRGRNPGKSTEIMGVDLPFDVPSGWIWTSMEGICSKTGSGSTPRGGKDAYIKEGVVFLRSQNVHDIGLRLDDVAYIDNATHRKMSGTAVRPADILLNITGGSIGRCCRVPDYFPEANISQHVAIVRVALNGLQDFLHLLIRSPYFQSFIFDEQTGAGRGGLPKNRMDRIPVALPPLAEQRRIFGAVDNLMAMCDSLEENLMTAEGTRRRLLETTLRDALEMATGQEHGHG